MVLHNYFKKALILFFIFCMGRGSGVSGDKHNHSNISLFNKNICKGGDIRNSIITNKRRVVYYAGSHRSIRKTMRNHNPYAVFATDILRKYIYIVNVVVIYIILYSL
jgi:hypothetical protein